MADLISKWTKEELFRLFTIASEEAQELDYDEFFVGMTMLLMDWRNTVSDRRPNPQGLSRGRNHVEEAVSQVSRREFGVQPAEIKYANRPSHLGQPKPPQRAELESPIRLLQQSGNRKDSSQKPGHFSPARILIGQQGIKAYVNAPKRRPLFLGDGPYLLNPSSLDKKGKGSSKDSKGRR